MKAAALVVALGLAFAGLSYWQWTRSDRLLDEETLRLDDARANLRSADGKGAYLIRLGHLEAGHRVKVEYAYRDDVNGTATVREAAAITGLEAPPPGEGALARADGVNGTLVFEAPAAGDYVLVLESPEKTPKGKVRVTWDPPLPSGRNPVYLGAARAILTLSAGTAGVLALFAWRARRARAAAAGAGEADLRG